MKKIAISLTLLFIVTQSVIASVFTEKKFFSNALNREETYYISFPTGYNEADTTTKYPVIIFLHGATVDAKFMKDKIDAAIIFPLTSPAFKNIHNVIFVIPDGSCEPFLGSFYTNSVLYGNYEDYIWRDLISEVRKNYNTFPFKEKWSIMGHSMGGYGSMKIALKHPGNFAGIASLSGPLHITHYDEILPVILEEQGGKAPYNFTYNGSISKLVYSMAGAFSPDLLASPQVKFPINQDGTLNQEVVALWDEHNPINMISNWKGNPSLAIYMYCGGADEYKIQPMNQMFSDSLTKYSIAHTYETDENGDHVNSLLKSFPKALNFLVNVMDTLSTETNFVSSKIVREKTIKVYPNPANNIVYIDTKLDIQQIAIVSLSGAVIEKITSITENNSVPVGNLNQGYYLLRIQSSDGNWQHVKFIKK